MSSAVMAYVQAKGKLVGAHCPWNTASTPAEKAPLIAYHKERVHQVLDVVVDSGMAGMDLKLRGLFDGLLSPEKVLMDVTAAQVRAKLRVDHAEKDAKNCRLGDDASRALAEAQCDYARIRKALTKAKNDFEQAEKCFVFKAHIISFGGELMRAFIAYVRARVILSECCSTIPIAQLLCQQAMESAQLLVEAADRYQ